MNSNADTQALLIFIKNPELGKVKTRLAETVGAARALQIYEALLGHTRRVALEVPATRYLYYSSFVDQGDHWASADFSKAVQLPGDLGSRMNSAFEQVLTQHAKAVIIGSDCASLTAAIVQEAFQALDAHDFVIGPAEDGGYYLLGMRAPAPWIFQDVDWSTEAVLDQTLRKIQAYQKTCRLLTRLSDIDYEEDWEQHGWAL